jgi:hypothetical protein
MMRLRWWRMAAVGVVLLAAARVGLPAPAPADRSGLEEIPAGAPIVVHLRGVQGTHERLVTLLKNALPEVAERIVPQLDEWLKEGIMGRKLRGLEKNGPIFLVFTEMPKPNDNPPKMAFLFAVSNFTEFRDNVLTEAERKEVKDNGEGVQKVVIENEATYFVDRKKFAIVTPNEEVAKQLTKTAPGLRLSPELTAKLMSSDLGLYVSMDAFNKDYAEQIKLARKAAGDALEQASGQVGKAEKGVIDLMKGIIGPVFQAVEDSQGLLMTFEFRPGGLAFHVQTEVRANSPTAATLKDGKPSPLTEIQRMPDGRLYYIAVKTGPAIYKKLGPLMFGITQDPESKEAKAITAALDQLVNAGPGVRADGFSLPPAGIQVFHYEDPAKATAAMVDLIKALEAGGSFQSGTVKEKPVLKLADQKYGGFDLNYFEVVWDLEKMADKAGQQLPEQTKKQLAEAMKGVLGEKMNCWFGTDGKVVLQVMAPDWSAAQKLLDQYSKGIKPVSEVKAFRDVRKELPSEATFLGLIDAVQYLGIMVEIFKPMVGGFLPIPPKYPELPSKDNPSFVGGAVTLQPQRGGMDLFLSAPAIHEFYKAFVKPLMGGN